MRGLSKFTVAVGVALALLTLPAVAQAAFPGQNGKIAFHRTAPGTFGALELWSIEPDGTGEAKLTDPPNEIAHSNAAYSADGQRIVFDVSGGGQSIHMVTATGAGDTPVSSIDPSGSGTPSWSPDGTKIAFTDDQIAVSGQRELYVMNADGTGAIRLVDSGVGQGTSWSPDGSQIAYTGDLSGIDGNIHVINADGTGDVPVTASGDDSRPDWSPDGSRITFSSDRNLPCAATICSPGIYAVNADGTGETNLTVTTRDTNPAWSPDGTQIAFQRWPMGGATNVYRMNADGSGVMQVTTNLGFNPSWQPVILGGYPRPKAATPLHASLVPALRVCQSPNRVHAPSLSYSSCNPPIPASSTLTTGLGPDFNGAGSSMVASARYRVTPGNPGTPLDEADIAIDVSVTDVRCASTSPACPDGPQSDYAGRLLLINPPLQLTDKDGQPATNGQGAATGQTNFPVPFDCTPTVPGQITIGSSCSISTTADAVVPNVIKEGHRAIWESGPVHVRDAGPNGTGFGAGCPPACGDGDETLFLRQGIFVP